MTSSVAMRTFRRFFVVGFYIWCAVVVAAAICAIALFLVNPFAGFDL